jgi:hypothetical protein
METPCYDVARRFIFIFFDFFLIFQCMNQLNRVVFSAILSLYKDCSCSAKLHYTIHPKIYIIHILRVIRSIAPVAGKLKFAR